MYFKIEKKEGR